MSNATKYKMITYTKLGEVFRKAEYTTKQGMLKSKEKQNLAYGVHLKAEAWEIQADGTEKPVMVLR